MKVAAVLFLFGILTFLFSYAFLFLTIFDIDHSLYKKGESTWPKYAFWKPTKSAEKYRRDAARQFTVAAFSGLASFVLFFLGLGTVLLMAVRLARGSVLF